MAHKNAKLLARARLAWGHPSGRIRAQLADQGLSKPAVEDTVRQGKAMRRGAFRRRGLASAALGVFLVAVFRAFDASAPFLSTVLMAAATTVALVGVYFAVRGCWLILFGGKRPQIVSAGA